MPPQPARLGKTFFGSAPRWRGARGGEFTTSRMQADQQASETLEATDVSVSLDKAMFANHFQS